jgi:hypothetical protein
MAKGKYIETPEKMWELWIEYKQYVKNNPRYSYSLSNKTGEIVAVPLECPLTLDGFYEFVCEHPETKFDTDNPDLSDYFENKDNRYSAYIPICTRIKRARTNDHITGGMVGQYNASITQRLNNLTERVDTTTKGEKIDSIKVTIVRPDAD